ncbi:hypothetical protein [Actinoplanes sp. URMC 104]|uniref:hypothetical protein n=1 Tax=Actinoplanes sp. URMC 104 TaxID=3423409 RepID=UPI003F1B0F60
MLVVGGLAGAAWLLTGAAAQAAERADGPDGSLLGSVMGADVTSPVTGLLQAAAQPLEISRPAYHDHDMVADILDVPRQVLHRPAATFDEIVDDPAWITSDTYDGADEIPDEVAAPHRPTGGKTAHQRLAAVTDAVADAEPPSGETPQLAADEPVTLPQPLVPDEQPEQRKHTALPAPAAGHRAASPVKHRKASSASSAHRHRHDTAHAVNAKPETAQEESTPGGDGPAAPLRLHLGDVSGTPANAPGPSMEGGSAAFLPAAIANSTMARHVPAIASDVDVRRHDAEAPTVSPD